MISQDKLRERLAEYAHKAWSGWMKYLFGKCSEQKSSTLTNNDGLNISVVIPSWAVNRWTRQVNTPYADLSEEEKKSDRAEADEMIAIFEKCLDEERNSSTTDESTISQ